MYLDTGNKAECFGCEGCSQVCAVNAITMMEDDEGFRYPKIDIEKCVDCNQCRMVCPFAHMPTDYSDEKYVFGGYHLDALTRYESTSGGAFSAIVEAFCDENYYVFGAEAKGLLVFHSYIEDIGKIGKFRKSKYSQSVIGLSYKNVKKFLKLGDKVLFSGTPCQVAGLLSFLGNTNRENLLTVEVVCEGVPSPLYIRKMEKDLHDKYGENVESLDYRYTGKGPISSRIIDFVRGESNLSNGNSGKWDFEQMRIELFNNKKVIIKDRWFNPFWSVWLQHLMSRPSCYKCPFTTSNRVADITLGDLWGVHIYCPELYGRNGGSSLIVCNSEKGKAIFKIAKSHMYGHDLSLDDALKYQGPMRKSIDDNPDRCTFMKDLKSDIDFANINKKWAKPPTLKLLFQKYIWGNRQKVFVWNLIHR